MFNTFTKKESITSWQGIALCLHDVDIDFNFPLYAMCGVSDKTRTVKIHIEDWKKRYPNYNVMLITNAGHDANMD